MLPQRSSDLGNLASSVITIPHLASGGVYSRNMSPCFRVRSYRTFPSLPAVRLRRFISVALFLWLPTLAVSKHPCSVMLGLSSQRIRRCAAVQPTLIKYTPNVGNCQWYAHARLVKPILIRYTK